MEVQNCSRARLQTAAVSSKENQHKRKQVMSTPSLLKGTPSLPKGTPSLLKGTPSLLKGTPSLPKG
jgi:hypothetical protein